jgi:hypothetical protein
MAGKKKKSRFEQPPRARTCRYCRGPVRNGGHGRIKCEACLRVMMINFHGKMIELRTRVSKLPPGVVLRSGTISRKEEP